MGFSKQEYWSGFLFPSPGDPPNPEENPGFPGDSDGKMSVYKAEDPGSIPGSGRSTGEGNGNPLQYFAWKIPWIEEPGSLQSMGLQRVDMTEQLHLLPTL